jgi:RHS repeat-associated protein
MTGGNFDNRKISSKVKPGYTGHEMLDDVGIIHMNGRIYDPELARFLSPDPVLQDPSNTQNYACYAYVFNNPLSNTDPTGAITMGPYARLGKDIAYRIFSQTREGREFTSRYDIKNGEQLSTYAKLKKIGGHQLLKAFQSYRKKHGFGKAKKEFYKKLGIKKKKWWKIAIVFVVAVVLVAVTAGTIAPAVGGAVAGAASAAGASATVAAAIGTVASTAVMGAAVGAGMSASMVAINGGSTSDILKAGIQGAVDGAKAGALTGLLGPIFGGAVNAELSGGDFKDGLISGAISGLVDVSGISGGLESMVGNETLGKALASALLGGTVSEIGGGKFANGALSAAFQSLVVSAGTSTFGGASAPSAVSGGGFMGNTRTTFQEVFYQLASGRLLSAARLIVGYPVSILSGDIFDTPTHTSAANIYVNGIFTKSDVGQGTADDITSVTGMQTTHVNNNSHLFGVGDILQILGETVGGITISSIWAADAMRQSGGGNLFLHSQGTRVGNNALALSSRGLNASFNAYSFGGQSHTSRWRYGLNSAMNIRSRGDPVPFATPYNLPALMGAFGGYRRVNNRGGGIVGNHSINNYLSNMW